MVIFVQMRLCLGSPGLFRVSVNCPPSICHSSPSSFSSFNFNFPSCHIIPTALYHSAALCSATPVRIAYPARQTNIPKGYNDELNGLAGASNKYICVLKIAKKVSTLRQSNEETNVSMSLNKRAYGNDARSWRPGLQP